jgi:uncharacterized protein
MDEAPSQQSPTQEQARGPVGHGERLVALDFIRGIAVLGILFANMTAFAHPRLAYWWPGALPGGGEAADRWIWAFQFVAVDGKFRGIFALLFGAGLALFVDRARAAGGSGALQLRRLALLGLIGLAHFYLLFTGDILFLYAVAGMGSLAFIDMEPRRQAWLGIVWYLVATSLLALPLMTPAMVEAWPAFAATPEYRAGLEAAWQARLAATEAERLMLAQGSLGDIVEFRLETQSGLLAGYAWLALMDTLPVMLLGAALYRLGLFSGERPARRWLAWAWAGVALGALATLLLGVRVVAADFAPQLTSFIFNGAAAPVRLPMILGLTVLLAAWAPPAARSWLGARVASAGRMALSNYVGTSLVMALVFQGWAGGLFGRLGRAELLAFVPLGWALMLAWSPPWLARFRYGPLEWLWRCLTYRRWFKLRR